MDMLLEEKHRAVRQSVRRFCDRELRPIAAQIDQEARFPWEVVEKMGALGYFGIQVPQTLGGAPVRGGQQRIRRFVTIGKSEL